MKTVTKQVTVQIGSQTRIFNLIPSEHGGWISEETYAVRYRTGNKVHIRKLSFGDDGKGNPTQFDPKTRHFEPVNLSQPINLKTVGNVAYGNHNSTETPYFQ